MKKCPSCNRTYTDDALSFCLEDGSPLLSVGSSSSSDQTPSFDPNATLQYNPARDTNPPPPQVYNPNQTPPPQYSPMPTPSWSPPPGPAQPKKSKAVYWILGSVAALVIVGIVGIVLLVVLVGSNTNANNSNNSNNSNAKNSNRNSNSNNSNANASNTNSSTTSDKTYRAQDDFSSPLWWTGTSAYGTAEYVNDEYQLSATSSTGWFVVYAPKTDNDRYYTQHATTRVTVHSVTGTSPSQGYGLTVYGLMKEGNLEDYGFLIRTDESPAFRVVLHQGGKETVMINWTRSSLIRTGSSPNQLEVRASDEMLSFYINGQFATSITDKANYKNGVAGFYSSDVQPVAFDDLEIFK
jgi:cytoskeletal protein RodZ